MNENMSKMLCWINGNLSEDFCRYTLYMVLNGLKELHDRNIIFGHLMSDYVAIKANGEIKLTDFYSAELLSSEVPRTKRRTNAVAWMPPDVA